MRVTEVTRDVKSTIGWFALAAVPAAISVFIDPSIHDALPLLFIGGIATFTLETRHLFDRQSRLLGVISAAIGIPTLAILLIQPSLQAALWAISIEGSIVLAILDFRRRPRSPHNPQETAETPR